MNIQILDSWLKTYLKTTATADTIAEKLSLTSVGVERVDKLGDDYVYDIEITTNRPDLMCITGLAREASAVLPQFDINAEYVDASKTAKIDSSLPKIELPIEFDSKIVNRICAVALEVTLKDSPRYIKDRLESTDINPHNNLIDI